jgi:uncharacterized DUF497 family protein
LQDLEFEWDEHKSNQVYEERGFDFGFAAQAFFDPQAVHQPDTRSGYGEVQDHARWCPAQGNT